MSEITLEKVDSVKERTGVTYAEAKSALEACDGNVVDALIYIENQKKNTEEENVTTKDEFISWIKNLINKGNVTRIKIKKNEKILVDIPVNAGVAVTGIAYVLSPVFLAIGVLTAVVTKVTIEITKDDGSVEVVNKIIKSTFDDVKDKFSNISVDMKDKFSNVSEEVKNKVSDFTDEVKEKFSNKETFSAKGKHEDNGNVYKYTVKFEDVKDEDIKEDNDKEEDN